MSEVKHTPAPWSLVLGDEEFWSVMGTTPTGLEGSYLVAEVINGNGHPENEANARLIAAAPELLEAVKALLCMLPSDHEERPEAERIPSSYCYVRWKEIREARAAISRATGEQDTGRESNG